MADWRKTTWGAEISLEYGKGIRGYADAVGPYRVFGSNGPVGWTTEPLAPGPGVILGRKGAYRGVQFSREPFFVIDTAYYVVPKSELDMRWLYYAIIYHKLGEIDDGSPIPSTTRAAVYVRDLSVPELPEQQATASILGALDDKIELNRRMNETLEQTARALFKDWFMRFCTNLPRVRAQELVDAGILLIGDGYRAKNDELFEPGLPFVRAGNLNDGFDLDGSEVLNAAAVARAGNKIARVGDVAFTSKGTIGRFARVGEHTGQFVYSPQVCFWRSLSLKEIPPSTLYCWMRSEDFLGQVLSVSGQTDMAPYVSLVDQRRMFVPDFRLVDRQPTAEIEPLLARQSLNIAECRTLASLRDLLLPKLLSGAIRVKDGEQLVGEAT